MKDLKKVGLLFFILFSTLLLGQSYKFAPVDSSGIVFKARLLTLERQGIVNKKFLLNDIEDRDLFFLKTNYKNFIFFKIKTKPPVGWYNNNYCYYYLAYNVKTRTFYKLGGFDYLDLDDFFEDLFEYEVPSMNFNDDVVELDLECLFRFYIFPKKKRLKKKNICYCTCSEEIIEVIENKEIR